MILRERISQDFEEWDANNRFHTDKPIILGGCFTTHYKALLLNWIEALQEIILMDKSSGKISINKHLLDNENEIQQGFQQGVRAHMSNKPVFFEPATQNKINIEQNNLKDNFIIAVGYGLAQIGGNVGQKRTENLSVSESISTHKSKM